MTIDEMIAVLQAAKAGKQIQRKCYDSGWSNISTPSWDFDGQTYRVKPEPREWMVEVDLRTGTIRSGFGVESQAFELVKVREVL